MTDRLKSDATTSELCNVRMFLHITETVSTCIREEWSYPLYWVVVLSEITHTVSSGEVGTKVGYISVLNKWTHDPSPPGPSWNSQGWWEQVPAVALAQVPLHCTSFSDPNSASASPSGSTKSGRFQEFVLDVLECSVCCVWSLILKKIFSYCFS